MYSVEASEFDEDMQVIIVDNASPDKGVRDIEEKFPDMTVIRNETNVGFASACNQGLERARGVYFLLLNPDTRLKKNTLRIMTEFMDWHEEAGIAGCRVLNPDGSTQGPCRRRFPTMRNSFCTLFGLSRLFPRSRLFQGYEIRGREDVLTEVDAVSGSFLMGRMRDIEEIGMLDDSFFLYGEDLDLCKRFADAGRKIYYVPDASIVHYRGQSRKKEVMLSVKEGHRAMRLFYRKHYASRNPYILNRMIESGIKLHEALVLLSLKLFSSERMLRIGEEEKKHE